MSKFINCKECGGSGYVGKEGWGIGEHRCNKCDGTGHTGIIFDDVVILKNGKKMTKKEREKFCSK